jgi:hypothetical protein
MNHADALTAPAADVLTEDFMDFLFQTLPQLVAPKPEDHWAFVPFMLLVLVFEPRGYVINICCLKHLEVCKLKYFLFISAIVLFCLPAFLGEPWLGRFRSHE